MPKAVFDVRLNFVMFQPDLEQFLGPEFTKSESSAEGVADAGISTNTETESDHNAGLAIFESDQISID